MIKLKPILWRAVFNPNNSDSSARIRNLNTSDWWTDSFFAPLYIHASHKPVLGMEGTRHRVYPNRIPGYVCFRLAMRRRVLCWLYTPKDSPSAKRAIQLWKLRHSK